MGRLRLSIQRAVAGQLPGQVSINAADSSNVRIKRVVCTLYPSRSGKNSVGFRWLVETDELFVLCPRAGSRQGIRPASITLHPRVEVPRLHPAPL